MATKKKLLQASAGTAAAGGGGGTDVSDVFSTFLYTGNSANQTIENGLNLGGSDAGPYTEFSRNASNVGGYLYRNSDFTSNSDSKTFTFSFWINSQGSNFRVYYSQGTQTSNYRFFVMTSNNYFKVSGFSSDGTTLLDTGWITITGLLNKWFNFLISVDMANTSNRYLYVNDAQVLGPSSSWDTYNNGTIDFTNSHHYVKTNGGSIQANGGLAQVYLDYTYRDLSVTSNRRAFIKADITPSGDLSSLNPILYLPLDYTNSTVSNLGTGGDFVAYNTNQIEAKEKGGPGIDSGGGEGGLVWIKSRNYTYGHALSDTEHTVGNYMSSNTNDPIQNGSNAISAFSSTGFSLGNDAYLNDNNSNIVSWTFLKAKKYFDCVTWTGNGVAGKTVSHNLGSVPGMIIIKQTNTSRDWVVYHRGLNGGADRGGYVCRLNTTAAQQANIGFLNDTEPTDSVFSLGISATTNQSGGTYVAYLFAHNDGDGDFGSDGDQDIISCGSYTGNGSSTGPVINLGWEPQFIITKPSSSTGNWYMYDTMRGLTGTGANDAELYPASNGTEYAGRESIDLTSTGFKLATTNTENNASGVTYIYMAIRAPMMKEPEAATDVFAVAPRSSTSGYDYAFVSNFPVDFGMSRTVLGATEMRLGSRLTGDNYLQTPNNQAEAAGSDWYQGDSMNSVGLGFSKSNESPVEKYAWMWKRAKGYADVVCYNPTSTSNQTITHSLGVKPEMVWIKQREAIGGNNRNWAVGMPDILGINSNTLSLNNDYANGTLNYNMFTEQPTATQFVLHGNEGGISSNGGKYIAYLFATLDGISKVGSYTGTGADLVVNCGFTSGARFVLIKRTDGTGPWLLFDVLRGITTASTDGIIKLNVTDASETEAYYGGANMIEPSSYGFKLTSDGELNTNGQTYIFYAIA